LSRWAAADPGRHLVVIEEGEPKASEVPGVRYFFISPETEEEVYRRIAWEFLYTPFSFEGSGLEKLAHIQAEVHFLASDFADQGVAIACNIIQNLSEKPLSAQALYGKFQNIPAIVCGAGPSLTKSGIGQLRSKALIFAGGATLDALKRLYVKPHFAAHVDPDPSHSPMATEAPLFYQLRTARRNVMRGSGPKLLVPGNGNFPLEKWAFPEPPFDGGWTVGTFCTALAYHLGCNPIIFAGMDLSSATKSLYAPGVETRSVRDALVPTKNSQGESVYARLDWLLARAWIDDFVKKHPKRQWISASDGVAFEGVQKLRLNALNLPILPLEEMVSSALAQIPTLSLPEAPSLKKAIDIVEKAMRELEAIFPKFESGALALCQSDLAEEGCFATVLEPAWMLWKPLILRRNRNGAFGAILNEFLFYRNLLKELYAGTLSRN